MPDSGRSNLSKVLLVIALLLGGVILYRSFFAAPDPYSRKRLSQDVTIRCTESGAEWEINRGWMERQLRTRGGGPDGLVDPAIGLTNPDTGTPTGFPVNREDDWDAAIERINAEKITARERGHR